MYYLILLNVQNIERYLFTKESKINKNSVNKTGKKSKKATILIIHMLGTCWKEGERVYTNDLYAIWEVGKLSLVQHEKSEDILIEKLHHDALLVFLKSVIVFVNKPKKKYNNKVTLQLFFIII